MALVTRRKIELKMFAEKIKQEQYKSKTAARKIRRKIIDKDRSPMKRQLTRQYEIKINEAEQKKIELQEKLSRLKKSNTPSDTQIIEDDQESKNVAKNHDLLEIESADDEVKHNVSEDHLQKDIMSRKDECSEEKSVKGLSVDEEKIAQRQQSQKEVEHVTESLDRTQSVKATESIKEIEVVEKS